MLVISPTSFPPPHPIQIEELFFPPEDKAKFSFMLIEERSLKTWNYIPNFLISHSSGLLSFLIWRRHLFLTTFFPPTFQVQVHYHEMQKQITY